MKTNDQNIWLQNKLGNFMELDAPHEIHLDFATNSIRFRIKANNFLYGYVISELSNWQKQESKA